ncbi:phosphoribosyltransferase [Cellulomonas sp. zg-ZUI222]|uniref:Phosphoribosyltransferase n=1 Tax=Cellulomonas wangleii TaxID=2816956 RepID=A0ABX8D0J3_9CELL|nr:MULTISPECIES: phosphoribosyltransferase family protein [Cellulomonas]MBO0900283.1 phosphoribosyltransferase [Cellulomonas sp. zg-ZUI22]MBO0920803.1 phosphoribosyltransferase [Cellulomonas wangleii]MBO0926601.1 phosphoribosyltransferase [Cellulomonas wangleii]QVI60839.1 phosphoribosyltransferase [Cellulomonas wangleii]
MAASTRPYADRAAAGQDLAGHLAHLAGERVVVLALPRGGVPVAAPVAQALRAPLDVVVVRKLGLPGHPEVAMGAIAGIGDDVELVHEHRIEVRGNVTAEEFRHVHRAELVELRRREIAYRGTRRPPGVTGQVVVLVDDGIATGATVRAAVAAVRRHEPERIVVAVPVGPAEAVAAVAQTADDVVCVRRPRRFRAVGQEYVDFAPPSDDQVRALLAGAGPARPRHDG